MNERYGNDYLTCIGKEVTYGTEQTTPEVVLPDKCEMKKVVVPIEISQKTGSLVKQDTEMVAGYTAGEVVLSGEVVPGATADLAHGILLEALMHVSATPFIAQAIGTAPFSYSIHQYFNDDKGHKGLGCVLASLELAGSTGGMITYSTTMRAKSVAFEQDFSVNPTDPFASIPSFAPAIFALTTLTTLGGETNITKLNSFSLSLSNLFADDALVYQNANVKAQEILTGLEGSFNVEWNYDKTNNVDVEGKLMVDALTSIVFAITDGANTWTFTLFGKITEYIPADPDKGIFVSSLQMTLMEDGSNEAISIAIT